MKLLFRNGEHLSPVAFDYKLNTEEELYKLSVDEHDYKMIGCIHCTPEADTESIEKTIKDNFINGKIEITVVSRSNKQHTFQFSSYLGNIPAVINTIDTKCFVFGV